MTVGKRWKSKFGNVRTQIDGIVFDSKGEAARWMKLRQDERDGKITDLKRQVPYRLEVNGIPICKYVADFTYLERGQPVTEDFKGHITPDCKIKLKLMLACHGIAVRITK